MLSRETLLRTDLPNTVTDTHVGSHDDGDLQLVTVRDPVTGRTRIEFVASAFGVHVHTSPADGCSTAEMGSTASAAATEELDTPSSADNSVPDERTDEGPMSAMHSSCITIALINTSPPPSKPLRGCLKAARVYAEAQEAGRRASDADGESRAPSATVGGGSFDESSTFADTAASAQPEEPSINIAVKGGGGGKKKGTKGGGSASVKAAAAPAASAGGKGCVRWGDVWVRELKRQVGGSGAIPEYTTHEWTLGLSDVIVTRNAATGEAEEVHREYEWPVIPMLDEEEEWNEQWKLAGLPDPSSAVATGGAGGGHKGGARHAGGSPRARSFGMHTPKAAGLKTPLRTATAHAPHVLDSLDTFALPGSALPSVRVRRATSVGIVRFGTVDAFEQRRQGDLARRFAMLLPKERAQFKCELDLETRQYSHKSKKCKGGNPLFSPLTERQRADTYTRDVCDTKDDAMVLRNVHEVEMLDAIHESRKRVGCHCHLLAAPDVKKWTAKRLRAELECRGLPMEGERHDHVERIVKYSEAVKVCRRGAAAASNASAQHDIGVAGVSGTGGVGPHTPHNRTEPFILSLAKCSVRALHLESQVLREQFTFFSKSRTLSSGSGSGSACESTAPASAPLPHGALGESVCPCITDGVGCNDGVCKCSGSSCLNSNSPDCTCYAYDRHSVEDIVKAVISKTSQSKCAFLTEEEMAGVHTSVEHMHAKRAAKAVAAAKAAAEAAAAAEATAACDTAESGASGAIGGEGGDTPGTREGTDNGVTATGIEVVVGEPVADGAGSSVESDAPCTAAGRGEMAGPLVVAGSTVSVLTPEAEEAALQRAINESKVSAAAHLLASFIRQADSKRKAAPTVATGTGQAAEGSPRSAEFVDARPRKEHFNLGRGGGNPRGRRGRGGFSTGGGPQGGVGAIETAATSSGITATGAAPVGSSRSEDPIMHQGGRGRGRGGGGPYPRGAHAASGPFPRGGGGGGGSVHGGAATAASPAPLTFRPPEVPRSTAGAPPVRMLPFDGPGAAHVPHARAAFPYPRRGRGGGAFNAGYPPAGVPGGGGGSPRELMPDARSGGRGGAPAATGAMHPLSPPVGCAAVGTGAPLPPPASRHGGDDGRAFAGRGRGRGRGGATPALAVY